MLDFVFLQGFKQERSMPGARSNHGRPGNQDGKVLGHGEPARDTI